MNNYLVYGYCRDLDTNEKYVGGFKVEAFCKKEAIKKAKELGMKVVTYCNIVA